jgi:protein-tyrosine-phosphatase
VSGRVKRLLVAAARRLERPAGSVLGRSRVRLWLHGRAVRAWRGTDAPLILCYGNINRSAFAAALAVQRGRAGAHGAGFYPEEGRSVPGTTIAGARRYGVDLAGHRSRLVTRADLEGARAIFVFDLQNLVQVAALAPSALARTHLVGSLGEAPCVLIADPHGRGEAVLESTLARVAAAVDRVEAAR